MIGHVESVRGSAMYGIAGDLAFTDYEVTVVGPGWSITVEHVKNFPSTRMVKLIFSGDLRRVVRLEPIRA